MISTQEVDWYLADRRYTVSPEQLSHSSLLRENQADVIRAAGGSNALFLRLLAAKMVPLNSFVNFALPGSVPVPLLRYAYRHYSLPVKRTSRTFHLIRPYLPPRMQ